MWKEWWTYSLIAFFGTCILGAVIFGYLSLYILPPTKFEIVKQTPEGPRHFELKEGKTVNTHFDLQDPELAPPNLKTNVMLGYQIFNQTKKNAPEYAGNTLNCNDCHFGGGNSFGEKNGGISLVGVSLVYPRFSKRSGKMISLPERIQNCFMRSLNGKAPPVESRQMEALLCYLDWISCPIDRTKDVPWLGLPELKSDHTPDAKKGAEVFTSYCSVCHQPNGAGTEGVPPLWGDQSFNDGAGMNKMTMLSSFVYLNMPYQHATLTEEQALDVAAYVISQPRPHFEEKK